MCFTFREENDRHRQIFRRGRQFFKFSAGRRSDVTLKEYEIRLWRQRRRVKFYRPTKKYYRPPKKILPTSNFPATKFKNLKKNPYHKFSAFSDDVLSAPPIHISIASCGSGCCLPFVRPSVSPLFQHKSNRGPGGLTRSLTRRRAKYNKISKKMDGWMDGLCRREGEEGIK